MSPSSSTTTLLVWARNAGIAEAKNISFSPTPTTSGHSLRVPTTMSGSSAEIAQKA